MWLRGFQIQQAHKERVSRLETKDYKKVKLWAETNKSSRSQTRKQCILFAVKNRYAVLSRKKPNNTGIAIFKGWHVVGLDRAA
jgi:hypothetical protein